MDDNALEPLPVVPVAPPEWRALEQRVRAVAAARATFEELLPATLLSQERQERRPTFVLERGEYDRPGDPGEAHTPACLRPMAADLPRNRRGCAGW